MSASDGIVLTDANLSTGIQVSGSHNVVARNRVFDTGGNGPVMMAAIASVAPPRLPFDAAAAASPYSWPVCARYAFPSSKYSVLKSPDRSPIAAVRIGVSTRRKPRS